MVKGALSGSIKGTLSRAVDFAATQGVPRHFSMEMIQHNDSINSARNIIVKLDPLMAELDVYEQYGRALIMIYENTKIPSV